MEVSRLGVELELQLLAIASATAIDSNTTSKPHLRPTLQRKQCQIPDLLSEARDQSCIPHGYEVHFHCATTGTSLIRVF